MNDAELKLLKAKESLLQEIKSLKGQISYCIGNGATRVKRDVFDKKLENGHPATIELSKDEYTTVLDYLKAVEEDQIYTFKPFAHMEGYYTELRIKNELLAKL